MVVPDDAAEHLRTHYATHAALHQRAVPLSVAATTPGITIVRVTWHLQDGRLTE